MAKILVPEQAYKIPRDYSGYVFVSDIDKTYLATQIDSLGGLLRAAFETAELKANVPGFSIILRAIKRGILPEAQNYPLFFVSASPPQIQKKLLSKMELDGVEHNGIIFKDQLKNVRSAQFGKLTEQIGYKLSALLSLWSALPQQSKLVLFGDDSESDVVIYSLFVHILAGHLRALKLSEVLQNMGVYREEASEIAWFSRRFKTTQSPVQSIFINLATGVQPAYLLRFGNFIFPSDNSLQCAIALFEHGLIREQAIKSISKEMLVHYDFSEQTLYESMTQGLIRGLYSTEVCQKVRSLLFEAGYLPESVMEKPLPEAQRQNKWGTRDLTVAPLELKRLYSRTKF